MNLFLDSKYKFFLLASSSHQCSCSRSYYILLNVLGKFNAACVVYDKLVALGEVRNIEESLTEIVVGLGLAVYGSGEAALCGVVTELVVRVEYNVGKRGKALRLIKLSAYEIVKTNVVLGGIRLCCGTVYVN